MVANLRFGSREIIQESLHVNLWKGFGIISCMSFEVIGEDTVGYLKKEGNLLQDRHIFIIFNRNLDLNSAGIKGNLVIAPTMKMDQN